MKLNICIFTASEKVKLKFQMSFYLIHPKLVHQSGHDRRRGFLRRIFSVTKLSLEKPVFVLKSFHLVQQPVNLLRGQYYKNVTIVNFFVSLGAR